MPQLIPERRAVELIREHGRRLACMHTVHGVRWFIVPGARSRATPPAESETCQTSSDQRTGCSPDSIWKITGGRP
jgi:hypothetical protein